MQSSGMATDHLGNDKLYRQHDGERRERRERAEGESEARMGTGDLEDRTAQYLYMVRVRPDPGDMRSHGKQELRGCWARRTDPERISLSGPTSGRQLEVGGASG